MFKVGPISKLTSAGAQASLERCRLAAATVLRRHQRAALGR
jgi:hypothetical protein